MSDRKPFVAISAVSSEYETYIGVVTVRYGTFQTWQALATLVEVAKQKWPEVNGFDAHENEVQWFQSIPWKELPEGATDEVMAVVARQEEVEQGLDGGWQPVDVELLDLENGQHLGTTSEHVQIDAKHVHFSFYQKHGDHRLSSDWLPLRDLDEHFHGG